MCMGIDFCIKGIRTEGAEVMVLMIVFRQIYFDCLLLFIILQKVAFLTRQVLFASWPITMYEQPHLSSFGLN